MKSHTKRALRAMPATQVQISMPVQGVLRDCRVASRNSVTRCLTKNVTRHLLGDALDGVCVHTLTRLGCWESSFFQPPQGPPEAPRSTHVLMVDPL